MQIRWGTGTQHKVSQDWRFAIQHTGPEEDVLAVRRLHRHARAPVPHNPRCYPLQEQLGTDAVGVVHGLSVYVTTVAVPALRPFAFKKGDRLPPTVTMLRLLDDNYDSGASPEKQGWTEPAPRAGRGTSAARVSFTGSGVPVEDHTHVPASRSNHNDQVGIDMDGPDSPPPSPQHSEDARKLADMRARFQQQAQPQRTPQEAPKSKLTRQPPSESPVAMYPQPQQQYAQQQYQQQQHVQQQQYSQQQYSQQQYSQQQYPQQQYAQGRASAGMSYGGATGSGMDAMGQGGVRRQSSQDTRSPPPPPGNSGSYRSSPGVSSWAGPPGAWQKQQQQLQQQQQYVDESVETLSATVPRPSRRVSLNPPSNLVAGSGGPSTQRSGSSGGLSVQGGGASTPTKRADSAAPLGRTNSISPKHALEGGGVPPLTYGERERRASAGTMRALQATYAASAPSTPPRSGGSVLRASAADPVVMPRHASYDEASRGRRVSLSRREAREQDRTMTNDSLPLPPLPLPLPLPLPQAQPPPLPQHSPAQQQSPMRVVSVGGMPKGSMIRFGAVGGVDPSAGTGAVSRLAQPAAGADPSRQLPAAANSGRHGLMSPKAASSSAQPAGPGIVAANSGRHALFAQKTAQQLAGPQAPPPGGARR